MMKKFEREIAWLKRDKYKGEEVGLGVTKSDFERLNDGEPLDYVIGWREFLGCKIDLSTRPLIPRAETEFWVSEAIKELGGLTSKLKVLDLFAGSGCIGLAIQKHLPKAQVTFGDLYPVNRRIIKTNIFSNITGRFDIIFANPPYVSTDSTSLTASHRIQKSVKEWEPKSALFAGPDGLSIIKKFLKQAKDHLKQSGRIYLEFGQGQKTKIEKLIQQFDYAHCRFHRDQFGRWRWVVIC